MRSLQICLCLSWYQSAELWVYFYKVHSQPNTKTGCSLEICIMSHRTSRIPFPTQIFTISFWFIVWLYDDQPIQCENRSDYWATSKQTVDITVSFSRLCIWAHTSAFNISHHHMSACAFCQLVIIQTSPAHFRYIPGLISSLCLWCKSSGSGVVHTNTDLQLICTLSARFFPNTVLSLYGSHGDMNAVEGERVHIHSAPCLHSKRGESRLSEIAWKIPHPLFELVQSLKFPHKKTKTKKHMKGWLTWTQSWILLISSPYQRLKPANYTHFYSVCFSLHICFRWKRAP